MTLSRVQLRIAPHVPGECDSDQGIHFERGSMTAAMDTMERMKEAGVGPATLVNDHDL